MMGDSAQRSVLDRSSETVCNSDTRGRRTIYGAVVSPDVGRGRCRLVTVCRVAVPANYEATLVGLRRRLGLSQQQLAYKGGAANKAVVYQWESGKRKPSQVFWLRIERLQNSRATTLSKGPVDSQTQGP